MVLLKILVSILSFEYYGAFNNISMQFFLVRTVRNNYTAMNNYFNNFWHPRFSLLLVQDILYDKF
jgi:hypothetical protein